MKSVTYEEFKGYGPCWLETSEGRRKLERIGRRKERWTAVDILDLPDSEVSAEDKLWAVLRPELIEEVTLHEFACRCAGACPWCWRGFRGEERIWTWNIKL